MRILIFLVLALMISIPAFAEESSDGRSTASGGANSTCSVCIDGRSVSCGGKADYCADSADGRKTACEGEGK